MEAQQENKIPVRPVSDFFDNEYKGYAVYTIENRAIPSVIDGFKPTARKVAFVADQVWKRGDEKPMKVFQLAGRVAATAFYHHGNASLESNIIGMAQDFKNSMPIFQGIGQFGSLRSPEAGAPRYVGVRFNENFRLLYKDFELLDFKEEEGEHIEPRYFLPIIPTVLINGSQGISVGFTSNVLNRDVKGIADACIDVIKGRTPREVKPSLNEFTGEFTRDPDNHKRWIIRGKFQRVNTSTVRITELPPSHTYEKYEEILDDLCEKKKIVSYDDNCADNCDYTIKFTRADLEQLDDEKLIKLLKLEEAETEAFSTLDENGKLRIFQSAEEIIEYFVEFRLGYYHKRKAFLLDRMNKDLKLLSNRGRFIKAILDEKLKINNVPKAEIVRGIETLGLDLIEGSYDYLLRMPIYSLTQELFEKLKADFTAKKAEIKKLEETDPKDMYLDDLDDLKKKFK